MKIDRNHRKINETNCQKLPRKDGEQFQAANKGLRPASSSCFQKSTKIGAKGSPGGATSSFELRTACRVGAVGGGRGREVYLLNLQLGIYTL